VDKVLALFGRAEARDLVDLTAVEPRYGLGRLCRLAAEKDPGLTLKRDAERWRERASELAHEQDLRRDLGRDL
jgi:hypothetical protein